MNAKSALVAACVLLVSVLSGCQSSGTTSAQGKMSKAQSASPPPVRYVLCSENLPVSGKWKSDPIFGDVNGDGKMDLAGLPRLGKGPRVWLGDGMGGWQESSTGLRYEGKGSCGGGLQFADVNDDGHLDLVVADHCQGIFVYIGDGAGNWKIATEGEFPEDLVTPQTQPHRVQMVRGAEDLDVGDVDGDGRPDIVSASSDEGGINVYLGDGTGRSWTHVQTNLPNKGWANRVRLADLNGDYRLDIIATYSLGIRTWLNDGGTGWKEAFEGLPTPMMQGIYIDVAIGDINEDGRPDLATSNWVDGPEIYLQQADGSWSKQPDVFPQMLGGSTAIDLADLDNDGHLDIAVSGRLALEGGFVRGVFALFGDGTGKMRYVGNTGLPNTGLSQTSGLTAGDMNGDGLPDIAAGSGLTVETAPGRTEPIIDQRLIVWCAQEVSSK